jgi:vacuolar-type H+-ATPase subunit F/Vma7
MIGIIGYQDDVIGFGLTGIEHLKEVNPNATKQDIQHAQEQLEGQGVDVIIIPAALREHLTEHDNIMIITIPEENNNTAEQIEALSKELLGVQL